MSKIDVEKIRNIAVTGHAKAGKTSLVETMLHSSGGSFTTKALSVRAVNPVAGPVCNTTPSRRVMIQYPNPGSKFENPSGASR